MCDLAHLQQEQIHSVVDKHKWRPHPSGERRPGGDTVAQVPQDPDDDDGRVQHVDFGLERERWSSVRMGGAIPDLPQQTPEQSNES